MTDIAFSIDSILAAVAMADSFPERFGPNGKMFIVFVGGVLGIITMRFVVRYFVTLLDRFPGLAEGAYYLVAWIGLKLVVSGIHDGPSTSPTTSPSGSSGRSCSRSPSISLVVKPRGVPPDHSESLELLESEEESDDERPSDSGGEPNGDEPADGAPDSDESDLLRSGPGRNPSPGQTGLMTHDVRAKIPADGFNSARSRPAPARSFWSTRDFSLLTVLGATPHCWAISAGVLPMRVSWIRAASRGLKFWSMASWRAARSVAPVCWSPESEGTSTESSD